MGKLCQNNSLLWWSLFCISWFALLGNGGAGKDRTLAMKGRPYYKEEAIVKTIEVDGDIYDCVDIYKQPAFDHPLLKDHVIQMEPSFIPESSNINRSVVEDAHPCMLVRVGCPEGSIPIRRMPYTYMDGLIGKKLLPSGSRMHHTG